jgi:hypothetical protein
MKERDGQNEGTRRKGQGWYVRRGYDARHVGEGIRYQDRRETESIEGGFVTKRPRAANHVSNSIEMKER